MWRWLCCSSVRYCCKGGATIPRTIALRRYDSPSLCADMCPRPTTSQEERMLGGRKTLPTPPNAPRSVVAYSSLFDLNIFALAGFAALRRIKSRVGVDCGVSQSKQINRGNPNCSFRAARRCGPLANAVSWKHFCTCMIAQGPTNKTRVSFGKPTIEYTLVISWHDGVQV